MLGRRWIQYDNCDDRRLTCPCCSGDLIVLTDLTNREINDCLYQDGDKVKCTEESCDLENGYVSCDGEEPPSIDGDW